MKSQRAELGHVIDAHRGAIEQRWIDRLRAEVVHDPQIELTALKDGMPDYLAKVVELLIDGQAGKLDLNGHRAWEDVAREHGITRVRHGFDIRQLLHEFIVLREVIRDVVKDAGVVSEDASNVLTRIIDAAAVSAVHAYVDARDYEARQRQAENIGFMTHELKSPLAAAMLVAARLRREVAPPQLPLCDRLDGSHRRLLSLIESVLLTEKLEANKIDVELRDVPLEAVMEAALGDARATAESKGLKLDGRWDSGVSVRVDPVLAQAAIENITYNAVKYTDDGRVEVRAVDAGEFVEVHVRDNCDGLSAEELKTIFEPFRRGATEKEGTGLGLAIAKRAVEAQGGSIHAESPGDRGCHFWVRLRKSPHRADARHAAP